MPVVGGGEPENVLNVDVGAPEALLLAFELPPNRASPRVPTDGDCASCDGDDSGFSRDGRRPPNSEGKSFEPALPPAAVPYDGGDFCASGRGSSLAEGWEPKKLLPPIASLGWFVSFCLGGEAWVKLSPKPCPSSSESESSPSCVSIGGNSDSNLLFGAPLPSPCDEPVTWRLTGFGPPTLANAESKSLLEVS